VKPANSNQGHGIEIASTIREINSLITSKPLDTCWVVQKYIERPLLYQGRKFDIRMWVMVNWNLDVFFYQEGYIRTSHEEY
jgi:hypothetical protein